MGSSPALLNRLGYLENRNVFLQSDLTNLQLNRDATIQGIEHKIADYKAQLAEAQLNYAYHGNENSNGVESKTMFTINNLIASIQSQENMKANHEADFNSQRAAIEVEIDKNNKEMAKIEQQLETLDKKEEEHNKRLFSA